MDARGLREFLERCKKQNLAQGNFLGFLHLLIGRTLATKEGGVLCSGLPWRDLAAWLKKIRWDKGCARELGLDPEDLPPRNRARFWYTAITRAQVDSPAALQASEKLAAKLRELGYVVDPPARTRKEKQ